MGFYVFLLIKKKNFLVTQKLFSLGWAVIQNPSFMNLSINFYLSLILSIYIIYISLSLIFPSPGLESEAGCE